MKILMTQSVSSLEGSYVEGMAYELPDSTAYGWIANGWAVKAPTRRKVVKKKVI